MKFKRLCLFLMIVGLFFITKVNASGLPYDWIIDGEEVFDSNSSKTATIEKDANTVTLTLNNYNGGSLQLNCYGTGQDGLTFIINLVGDNKITTDDVGIDFLYNGKIIFNGDGNLTINSFKPISYENYSSYLYISPSENIYTDKKPTTNDVDSNVVSDKNNNSSVEKKDHNNYSDNNIIIILIIAFSIYLFVSIIIIALLVSKNKKLKNNMNSNN